MRIAAYNVENLFDRAKVFNDTDDDHRDILSKHAELNDLFEKSSYSIADKTRMIELIGDLGMLNRSRKGPWTFIRKIRRQPIRIPTDHAVAPTIVVDGRDDWVGWCELVNEAVDETAMELTARTIFDSEADVLALVEAESRPVLLKFQDLFTEKFGLSRVYRHLMLVDGNDDRGIDVGLATRDGYQIGRVRSHVDDLKPDGHPIFSRDCPEYEVMTPSGQTLFVLPNHFKSKFGGDNKQSQDKRRAQSAATAAYYNRLRAEGAAYIVVLGDLNDTPHSTPLAPLLQETDLKDASEHPTFTDFEFFANNGQRGIGTYGYGNDNDKIDYLLLSPALFEKMTRGGIFRKGAWPGSRPKRWSTYADLKKKHHAASDHHLIWADIDI